MIRKTPSKIYIYNPYLLLILPLLLSACTGVGVKETQPEWNVSTQSGLAQGISIRKGVVSWIVL